MMKSNFGQIKDIYDVLWVYNDGLYELGVCHYRSIVKVVIISSIFIYLVDTVKVAYLDVDI